MNSGYAHVQNWVANTILQQATDNERANIAMITVPNRSAAYDYDAYMFTILDNLLPYATLIVFFLPVFRMTYRMVSEKETRIRESMTMMGLTQSASNAKYKICAKEVALDLIDTVLSSPLTSKPTSRCTLYVIAISGKKTRHAAAAAAQS